MKIWSSLIKRITIADYSIASLCLLYLTLVQISDANLKFVKGDYLPVDYKTFAIESSKSVAIIQSYSLDTTGLTRIGNF